MTLMERRRALMEAQGGEPSEQWDYVWKSADGLPNNNGAELYLGGTGEAEITSDGLKISAPGNTTNYIAYRYTQYNFSSGIIEVDFTPHIINDGQNLRIAMSNGSNGAATQMSQTEVKVYNGASICQYTNDVKNTLRLHLRGNVWDLYLNGTLEQSNLPKVTNYTTTTQVMYQAGGTGGYVVLHSIKIKEDAA